MNLFHWEFVLFCEFTLVLPFQFLLTKCVRNIEFFILQTVQSTKNHFFVSEISSIYILELTHPLVDSLDCCLTAKDAVVLSLVVNHNCNCFTCGNTKKT